jgi:hypothetical protein
MASPQDLARILVRLVTGAFSVGSWYVSCALQHQA